MPAQRHLSENDKALLEVWKATVDVQKHFNDLSVRVRSIALTILAAFLAAAGYTLREGSAVLILGKDVALTGLVLVSAALVWAAFYFMDRHWYHRLLRGAVSHGRDLETALSASLPEIGLTKKIDEISPVQLGRFEVRARHKLDAFYGLVGALLITGAVVSFCSH